MSVGHRAKSRKKPACNIYYMCSSIAHSSSNCYAIEQTYEVRAPDHGCALDSRSGFHPRDPGGVPGKRPACLHNHPDNRLSLGSEEGVAPREEGRQLSRVRSHCLARCRAPDADRRSAGSLWRTYAALYGAPDTNRQAFPGRRKRGGEDIAPVFERGQIMMVSAGWISLLANHLWQSTVDRKSTRLNS